MCVSGVSFVTLTLDSLQDQSLLVGFSVQCYKDKVLL